ncbi:MAG: type pilus assembly protein PilB [Patescibacteria group bacterium]|nr:type pilus assembly protein PilB [Patescibacteria group bacterium]
MKDVGRRLKLGEILLNEGLITPAQLERALACKEGSKKTLGEILIELEFIEERTILMCVSRQLNIQYLDVSRDDFSILDPELRETLGSVPKSLWTELNCLPIFHIDSTSITSAKKSAPSSSDAGKREYRGGHLSVVMSDPLNKAALEKIEKATFAEVSAYVCNAASIRKGIEYMFAPNRAPKQTPGGMNVADMGKYVRYLNKLLFLGVLR